MTLAPVPHVDAKSFDDYYKRIGPLYEQFKKGRAALLAESALPPGSRKTSQVNLSLTKDHNNDTTNTSTPARRTSSSTLSPGISPHHRRRSSAQVRRKPNEPTPLSTIPPVYFESDFHLENPRTFDVVSERAEIVRSAPGARVDDRTTDGALLPPRRSLAANAVLQEKLSWYMDTVEIHLINSISTASTSFFAALGSLKTLQQEASESVVKIQALRSELAVLDRDMVDGGLRIARLRQKSANIGKLARATRQLEHVTSSMKDCELCVDEGRHDDATTSLEELERLMAGEKPMHNEIPNSDPDSGDLIDLRGLDALQNLRPSILNLQTRIGKGYQARFMETLLTDLRQHVESVPRQTTILRWATSFQRYRGDGNSAMPAYLKTDPKLRSDLLASLQGLHRASHIAQAATAYQDAVTKEMKALIRKHLPSSNDDDAASATSVSTRASKQQNQQDRSAALARNLRALDEGDAELLFTQIYTGVSEALRRLGVQIKILLDVTSSFAANRTRAEPSSNPTSPRTPTNPLNDNRLNSALSPVGRPVQFNEDISQALDMSSLLGQAVDVVQIQVSRVLKVRTEQTQALPLDRFVRYYTLNRLLADECEAVSGRSGQMLKNILSTQLNGFVQVCGEAASQEIAEKLDTDPWEAYDIIDTDLAILSRVLEGMNKDAPTWTSGTRVWEDAITQNGTGTITVRKRGDSLKNGKSSAKVAKPAYIDETRYVLIKGAVAIVPIIDRFLAMLASIPSAASVAIPALSEVLRTFNSRISQLILGAGATRVAGLKNITTKHLALASQALSFVIALIPYIREGLKRHVLGRSDTLGELDRVKRLYQDHQIGIHDKLVDIMSGRANAHVKEMKKIDFDSVSTSEEPSAYMQTLCKETATLQRVLVRNLAPADVADITGRIFARYKEQWSAAFAEVIVRTSPGKQRCVHACLLMQRC